MSYKEADTTIHTSMTDLMTSLVFVFILLLVVFLSKAQGESINTRDEIKKQIIQELNFLDKDDIVNDPEDELSVIVRVHTDKLKFKSGEYFLSQEGKQFLQKIFPGLVRVINKYEPRLESVKIDGYTDSTDSDLPNMKLSQDRAFEVFNYGLNLLNTPLVSSFERKSFINLTSASGWGERKLLPYNEVEHRYANPIIDENGIPIIGDEKADSSRRVEFKIRVKSIEQRKSLQAAKKVVTEIKEKTNVEIKPEL